MGKHKYSKGLDFLHVPRSSILREIKIYTIPITWENWILIARETYGKTQTFQSYSFLTYFMWSINPCNSGNMEKVNSNSKEKNIGKHKPFKVKGFLIFWLEAEIHPVTRICEKRIFMLREKHGKIQKFQIYGFWNISAEAEIHTIPKI